MTNSNYMVIVFRICIALSVFFVANDASTTRKSLEETQKSLEKTQKSLKETKESLEETKKSLEEIRKWVLKKNPQMEVIQH
jgi:septal ring factor EnvC (AmiA/AmiB activator)